MVAASDPMQYNTCTLTQRGQQMKHSTVIEIDYDTNEQLVLALVDILSKANTEYDIDGKMTISDSVGNKLRFYTVETYTELDRSGHVADTKTT